MTPFRGSAAFTHDCNHFDFHVSDNGATIIFGRPEKLGA